MLTIKTDTVTVEIEPDSHFYLKRGDETDDTIRVPWQELDEAAATNLRKFAEMVEGTLDGMISKAG